MEKKLSDAAMEGSVEKLNDLIRQDPLVLERALVSCVSETPLHVASMLGHLDMVVALLSHNPEFASELDSSGSTPLHLAAARGHVEVVKELMRVSDSAPAACLVKNGDGRTALHVAAIKGRVEVVAELVKGSSESLTRALTDRGESAMHLCAGYNRLECLRVLVEAVGKDNSEVLNLKDGDGNTVLHIAVAKKQFEMIKYLVSSTGVNVNALNANRSTALDILLQSPRDLRDMEIENCLRGVGAQRAKDIRSIEHDWGAKKQQQLQMSRRVTSVMSSNGERTTMTRRMTSGSNGGGDSQTSRRLGSTLSSLESETSKPGVNQKPHDWLGRKRSSLMVVASLLATTAFSAAITPPGGVWQDDYKVDENGNPVANPHTVGTSIMAYSNGGKEYGLFMIFNTVAFLASLSIILLLVSGLPIKKRRWMWIQMVIMWIAITTQVLTYFLSLRHMSPKNLQLTLRKVTEISVLTWLTLMVCVFFGNVIRLNLWVLRKYGYLPPKEERPLTTIDEELEEV